MNAKHIITILLLLICSGTASATTHTVCASGCDYTTIQAAENVAAAGDTVYVYSGTYTENIVIANASVTFEGEGKDVVTVTAASWYDHGVLVNANLVNISGFKINGATGMSAAGIHINGKDNCNIANNDLSSNTRGIYLSYSNSNTITNNIITGALRGIAVDTSDSNILLNNNISSNACGIWMSYSGYNNLTNNVITSNKLGIQLGSSSNNILTANTASNNYCSIDMDTSCSSNTITNNAVSDNWNTSSYLQTSSQEGNVGTQIDFNFVIKDVENDDCSSCTYGLVLSPTEPSFGHSKNVATVTGSFTPTRTGIYSLSINTTDTNDNTEKRKYVYLVDVTSSTTVDYYFRQVLATHEQPTTYGTNHDAGALLTDLASSDEEVWCSSYIGFSVDVLPNYLFGVLKNINYSIWYKTDADGSTGVQRYSVYSMDMDESTVVGTTAKTFGEFNFVVDWVNDYSWAGYWTAVKLKGSNPYIYSNQTHPSYANITYHYSTTPSVKAITNTDIQLLSATAPASDSTQASIVLDGAGSTYLVVQMPNTALTYTATWDGGACTGGDCSFTQSAGEINFTLTLGSAHTINISEAGAGTNDITLAANTYGFLCEDPSIAHPFNVIATEFAHEICFSWLDNSGACWESYWSGDAYNSDLSIPKHDAYFVLIDGYGETVSCGVGAAETVAIPTGWYATYLRESTAKTLTQIKSDLEATPGDATNLYTWDHNAGGTGAWVSVDVTPSHSVLPNQGILINNLGAPYNWDGTVN